MALTYSHMVEIRHNKSTDYITIHCGYRVDYTFKTNDALFKVFLYQEAKKEPW